MSFRHRMLAPLLIVFVAAVGFPVVYSVYLSFTDYQLTSPEAPSFVGLDTFRSAFEDPSFWGALTTTLTFAAIAVCAELVIGMGIALALRRQRFVRNITRAVLLSPMFVTPIAVGLMFRFVLNDQLGAIPRLLDKVGVSIDFFGPGNALISIALIDVWQWTPFMVLLLLAGLESLPESPFEAAKIDGASAWYTFRRVTLPLLGPVIAVAVVMRSLDALKVFEYVFAITRGGPGTETETIQYYVYKVGISYSRVAQASAMSLILLVLVLGFIIVCFRLLRRVRT